MYSKEQITKIRALINDYFDRGDVYDKLKQKIESQGLSYENLDNAKLQMMLQETNLLDNLQLDMKHLDEISEYNQRNSRNQYVNTDNIKNRSISFRIYKGKAFLDFVREEQMDKQFLQLYLSMGNQRFCSALVPARVDPEFNEVLQYIYYMQLFVFDLKTEGQKANQEMLILSKTDNPIELTMIYIDEKNQTRTIYSQKIIEWRFLLSYGNINLNIEMPITQEQKTKTSISEAQHARQTVGLLQIHLDLLPKSGLTLLPETVLITQLSKEKTLQQSAVDRFHTYSSAWWNDYKELRLPVRPVKIYAESQDGVWRAACTFISELVGVRGIPTPFDAARYVSLVPMKRVERGPQAGSERAEVWHRFSSFLAVRNGDFEDHCLLLCSLLLGFNMDAYVVIGASTDGAHGWVMTRSKAQGKRGTPSYVFWESLTGHHFDSKDPQAAAMYKKIGCIFSNKAFYANIQPVDGMGATDLNIDDYTKWKAIDPQEILNQRPQSIALSLLPPSLRADLIEPELETKIKDSIAAYRKVLNLTTRYDERLGGIMQIQLNNYKSERISGLSYCQTEFQEALKCYIPDGHIFKAFPMQFLHMDPERILESIKQRPVGGEVISARGDQVYLTVKVMLELYPDDVYAVWVIIAARFHQIA